MNVRSKDVLQRVEDRLDPARERVTEGLREITTADLVDELGDRVRGSRDVAQRAVSSSRDAAERALSSSRDAAQRVETYLEDHLDEETVEVWGPRAAFALAGFAVGFVLAWLLLRRRARTVDDEERGLAQAPDQDRPVRAVARPS